MLSCYWNWSLISLFFVVLIVIVCSVYVVTENFWLLHAEIFSALGRLSFFRISAAVRDNWFTRGYHYSGWGADRVDRCDLIAFVAETKTVSLRVRGSARKVRESEQYELL